MFAIPSPTPYDLKFRLLGIPVRVHPFFWAIAAALGWTSHDRFYVLVWIGCVFLSILVHEFGHGLTAERLYRARPSVYLYLMGGLCAYDQDDRRSWRRAGVLIMGPGAGFLLFGLVLAIGLPILGFVDVWPIGEHQFHEPARWFLRLPEWAIITSYVVYHDLLYINLFWGLFNLLPIYPLDGGQLAHLFLSMHNRREGPARAFIVGLLTAGGLAIYFATQAMNSESQGAWVNVFFIANLAFLNYQLLQAENARRNSAYSFDEDDDWWRK